jgi:hypothetical protein
MIIWIRKNVRIHMLDNGIVVPLGKLGLTDVYIAQIDSEFVVAVLGDVSGIGVSVSGSPFIKRISVDNTFYEERKRAFKPAENFFREYDNRQKTPVNA